MFNQGMMTSKSGEWATPQDFFDKLDSEFHFTLDPCSTDENAKCKKHFTKEQDGLAQDWTGETVYCNPPYGRELTKWVKKCYEHIPGLSPVNCPDYVDAMQKNDPVNQPSHYTGNIEVIDYLREKLTAEEFTGFCMGNVLKYTSRWRKKDGLQDLKKAAVYLGWAIENEEKDGK